MVRRLVLAIAIMIGAVGVAQAQQRPFTPQMAVEWSGREISGSTNLPDGTQLMATLSRPGDVRQTKFSVAGGSFKSGAIEGLLPGQYRLAVTSGSMNFQPAAVQAVLGKDGEALPVASRLVVQGPLGREFSLETLVQVGPAAPSSPPAQGGRTKRVLYYEEKIKPMVVDEIYALAASQCGFRSDRWYTTIKEGISMRLTADTAGWTRAEVSAFEADHLQAFKNASQKPISCSGLRSSPATLDRLDALERQITGNYH